MPGTFQVCGHSKLVEQAPIPPQSGEAGDELAISGDCPGCDRWKIGVAVDRLLAYMLAAAEQEYGEGDSDQCADNGAKLPVPCLLSVIIISDIRHAAVAPQQRQRQLGALRPAAAELLDVEPDRSLRRALRRAVAGAEHDEMREREVHHEVATIVRSFAAGTGRCSQFER
jgi:hypothetical protein